VTPEKSGVFFLEQLNCLKKSKLQFLFSLSQTFKTIVKQAILRNSSYDFSVNAVNLKTKGVNYA